MEPEIRKFRGALGGFNRRDVVQYIGQLTAQHRREVARLEKELADTEQERAALASALAGSEDEKGSAAAGEARVRASLEESTRSLTQLRGELEETETRLAEARAELARVEGELNRAAPAAENYEQLKDRVATVELDAHRKAQATVEEARAEAEQIREETRRWAARAMDDYAAARRGVDEILSSARRLEGLELILRQTDEAAARLKEKMK